jgi:hypothetical protein
MKIFLTGAIVEVRLAGTPEQGKEWPQDLCDLNGLHCWNGWNLLG